MQLRSAILVLIIGVFAYSCATIDPVRTNISDRKRIVEKNYTLGETYSVFVGEPVVKQKDYYIIEKSTNKAIPSNDFIVKGPLGNEIAKGAANQPYSVIATTPVDGVNCFVLKIETSPTTGLIINPDGSFSKRVIDIQQKVTSIPAASIYPELTHFTFATDKMVDMSSGYINYEIVYTGKSSDTINLLYREFTPDDLAKTAFYQNLTYSAKSDTVRFRKLKINIKEATNERLSYTVVSDE